LSNLDDFFPAFGLGRERPFRENRKSAFNLPLVFRRVLRMTAECLEESLARVLGGFSGGRPLKTLKSQPPSPDAERRRESPVWRKLWTRWAAGADIGFPKNVRLIPDIHHRQSRTSTVNCQFFSDS
jgi:hypothetical protein